MMVMMSFMLTVVMPGMFCMVSVPRMLMSHLFVFCMRLMPTVLPRFSAVGMIMSTVRSMRRIPGMLVLAVFVPMPLVMMLELFFMFLHGQPLSRFWFVSPENFTQSIF
jgi:hypothetical protein